LQTERISIIVPVYNSAKYLIRCVKSLVHQTYNDLEIVLINDGSTDDSGRICDGFAKKDKRIKVLHQQNKGVSAARNTGLNIATGKWIGFVDSDDYVDNRMFENLLLVAQSTDAEIVVCGYVTKYLDGHEMVMAKADIPTVMSGLEALEYVLKPRCMEGFLCNKLFHQKFFNQSDKLLREDIFFCEDLLFVVEAFINSKYVAYLPNAFYHYCMQEHGAMANYGLKRETELLAKRNVLSLVKGISRKYTDYVKIGYVDSTVSMLYAVACQGEYRQGVRHYLQREASRYLMRYLVSLRVGVKRKFRSLFIIAAPRLSRLLWKNVRSRVNVNWH